MEPPSYTLTLFYGGYTVATVIYSAKIGKSFDAIRISCPTSI
ncbi:hypothetical protein QE382_000479 [Sphingobacterium zeae]|uniref:Uncharacterized protein n=1 Tax=Sphingobacterium zeae TaxID=1776859 RepID=A0ABU0U0K6_9SPHI|nr:hypothetical protein [Sphingobacterium zeae]